MTVLWFGLAAAFGAIVRHGVNQLGFGWIGTLGINIAGAFALGALTASGATADQLTILGTGCCGSLTTFSMFSLETVEVHGPTRVWVVVTTVIGTVSAAALGYVVT